MCGEAGGKNGLTPELVKHAGVRFTEHIEVVWADGRVPKEWVDAVIFAIPKQGDLSVCDNWRESVYWMQLISIFPHLTAASADSGRE